MRFSRAPEFRPTYAEISLSHLRSNARWLKQLSPGFFCPMLKSNAYGHGDVDVAKCLRQEGIQRFGLALIEEACRLRENGLQDEELLVFGCFDEKGGREILKRKLIPVLSRWEEVEILDRLIPEGSSLSVHLKFNTGMARLGFEMEEADRLRPFFANSKKLRLEGLCSHLSHGEDAAQSSGHTRRQIEKLESLKTSFGGKAAHLHLLNSSGGLALWAHHPSSVLPYGFRPGLSLYGIAPQVELTNPQAESQWQKLPLKPVMRLRSGLIHYHKVKKGESVSYGGTWTAPRSSVVGIVPIGYADGYTRHFSNTGNMLFRGQRVPVVGTVCMDYTLIDLTDVLGDRFGDYGEEIVLIGEQGKDELTAEEVAAWAGTISYELITCIGRRVPRQYIDR